MFHYREAEAVAFLAAGRARGKPRVFAEELVALVGRDAGAGVADFDTDAAGRDEGGDGDAAAGGRELEGVAREIGERLIRERGVAAREREVERELGFEGDLFALGDGAVLARDGAREEVEIDAAARAGSGVAGDRGAKLQKRVDDPSHLRGGVADVFDVANR